MKLSRKWLNEFVDGVSAGDIEDRPFSEAMTLSGSKVEGWEYLGEDIKNVVVGQVMKLTQHPDSDHMWVCSVDAGRGEPLQIVTGAQNLQEGDYVPVALDDSYLPGGVHITAGKLRGVDSCGMLCSLKELGLTAHNFPYAIEDGIFVLSSDPELQGNLTPGADIVPVIGLDDHVVEFEITPNRPDCLSVIGMAREAAVTFEKELKLHEPAVKSGSVGNISDMVKIDIADPELCLRYTARMVKNVKIAPSPLWMRERIMASGMRPINNIVDITNYVMLEYGQPMHAFDFACVENGHIVVRTAREGEVLQTLDGSDRKLTPSMLCICDEFKPVGVAGVMGGMNSEIVGDTAMVLFESANFNGTSIRRTAAGLNMRTDASSRYEKGLDPYLTLKAVNRACELVELLDAGEVVEGYVDVFPAPPEPLRRQLDAARVNWVLGTEIEEGVMRSILLRLGFGVDEGGLVTVPSWRRDVSPTYSNNDFAEEVARIYGFDKIPATLMEESGATQGGFNAVQHTERTLGSLCRSAGYDEVITYSFYSATGYDMIRLPADSPLRRSITILNPLGEDTSHMRTTMLPSILEVLARNYNYRNKNARLYELGKTYFAKENGLADEPKVLALGAYGDDMDFYAMKGHIEAIAAELRLPELRFTAVRDNPSYHPGRCAAVWSGEIYIGVFGQVHPLVAKNYGVAEAMYAAELGFGALHGCRTTVIEYTPLPRFPAVMRDIAVVCAEDITAGELIDCIMQAGGEHLKGCEVFDIYRGANIPEGKKSVAFSLTLRSDDQTLTDKHADESVAAVLEALGNKYGARIR